MGLKKHRYHLHEPFLILSVSFLACALFPFLKVLNVRWQSFYNSRGLTYWGNETIWQVEPSSNASFFSFTNQQRYYEAANLGKDWLKDLHLSNGKVSDRRLDPTSKIQKPHQLEIRKLSRKQVWCIMILSVAPPSLCRLVVTYGSSATHGVKNITTLPLPITPPQRHLEELVVKNYNPTNDLDIDLLMSSIDKVHDVNIICRDLFWAPQSNNRPGTILDT